MIRINVGGRVFEATLATWSKSPRIRELIKYEPPFVIDRNPAVFEHMLDWMREGRIYIDRPDDVVYMRLCEDAKFYQLEDLQAYLANRVNLCRYVYLQDALNDNRRYLCHLEKFRALKPSNGSIDNIIAGKVELLGSDTILVDTRIGGWCGPFMGSAECWWKGASSEEVAAYKALFGDRISEKEGKTYYSP